MKNLVEAERRGWNDFIEWNDACPFDSYLEPELAAAWKYGYEAAAVDSDAGAQSMAHVEEDDLVDF